MDRLSGTAVCLTVVIAMAMFCGVTLFGVEGAEPPIPANDKPQTVEGTPGSPPTPPAQAIAVTKKSRLSIPSEVDQTTALEALRNAYKDKYAKRKTSDRAALGQLLLNEGQLPQQKAVHRWTCLQEAIDIAGRIGDVDTALAAVETMEKWFALPPREKVAQTLSAMTPNLLDRAQAQTAVFAALTLIDSCITADDYALALRLCKDCEIFARKVGEEATARAIALRERTKELYDEFAKLGELHDLLGEMTPKGHQRLGVFLCLFKNDWLPGVQHLLDGSSKQWSELAHLDVAAQKILSNSVGDGTQALAAGEAWRDIAATLSRGTERDSAQKRALTWYRCAQPALSGLNKTKAEKRIWELERVLGPVALGGLPLYPYGAALLLTFEAETLALADTRLSSVLDTSGSGLRFSATGPKPVRGLYGIALEFDGNSQIEIPSSKQLQISGNQTVAFWMMPSVLDLRRNPFNKAYNGEGTFTCEPDGTLNYYYGVGAENYVGVTMNNSVTAKTWVHLAVVRDFTAKTVTWYCNGKATNTVDTAYPAAEPTNLPLLIGNGYTGNGFIGQLDDIAVWPRALTSREVQVMYSTNVHGR